MDITAKEAAHDYQITTKHELMPNGERRFRLRKDDGTAYIRTEASSESGWQTSHFHSQVLETYIVQSGWMAFAELIGESLSLRIYEPGQSVISRPEVVHNVFLSSNAVIHTVKHGTAFGNDRLTDFRTEAFDIITKALKSEIEIRAAAIKRIQGASYSDEYRHFDTLIWQVPAWSTGIFALSVQALFDVLNSGSRFELIAAGGLALFTAICLICFSFVMMRFRVHQHSLKGYRSTTAWMSASTMTQSLITMEAAAAFTIALIIFDVIPMIAALIGLSTCIFIIWFFERLVRIDKVRA